MTTARIVACGRCGEPFTASGGRSTYCPTCRDVAASESKRESHLRRAYGITVEEYDAVLAAQGGGCAICGRPAKVHKLHVDHDHKTRRVRGILCYPCNAQVIGRARNSQLLRAGADYLDDPPAERVLGERLAPKRKSRRKRAHRAA